MTKNYYSLNPNTTLGFNKKFQRTIASGIDSTTCKTSWFFAVLVILGMTLVQKAAANQNAAVNHNTNLPITTSYTFHTVILKSSVNQGQSGGGGHGNADWVKRHPYDAGRLDIQSGILNTKEYNNNNYILHTLFNPIL